MVSSNPFFVTHRVVVGISDKAVSNSPNVIISTYALGSCLALVGYDPVVKAAGMIHFMLPDSKNRSERANFVPCMFADTGLPLLLDDFRAFRATPSRMRWALIGGAAVITAKSFFTIGEDNIKVTHEFIERHRLKVIYEDVGGNTNRTVHFSIAEEKLSVKRPDGLKEVSFG